jgi:hypothetical protein
MASLPTRFPDPTIGDVILDRLVYNAHRLHLTGDLRRKAGSSLTTTPTTCIMFFELTRIRLSGGNFHGYDPRSG